MAGSTIDHMVSVTVLIAALVLTMGLYNQMLASAIEYESHRQVTIKAVDLIDTTCLNPGNPHDWGQSNSTPLGFGLQDPESAGYILSGYSIMRLRTSPYSKPVYYNKTGEYYNNYSLGQGGSLLVPLGSCINYTEVATLMGVNGSYGFQITISPTINITISQIPESYLILKVEARGPGLPLDGATLKYHMYQVGGGGGNVPSLKTYSGNSQTDSAGSALIEFPSIDPEDSYAFIVYASLGGLNGVGYHSNDALSGYPEFIIPLIKNLKDGTVIIAHSWDVHNYGPPVPDVHYNATFFVLSEDFEMSQIQILNSSGHVNYGEGKPYTTTQVPASESGLLLISYRWGNLFGNVLVPWGISTLGVSATFGGDPSGYTFVATELRQVLVKEMAYQVKLAVWSLER